MLFRSPQRHARGLRRQARVQKARTSHAVAPSSFGFTAAVQASFTRTTPTRMAAVDRTFGTVRGSFSTTTPRTTATEGVFWYLEDRPDCFPPLEFVFSRTYNFTFTHWIPNEDWSWTRRTRTRQSGINDGNPSNRLPRTLTARSRCGSTGVPSRPPKVRMPCLAPLLPCLAALLFPAPLPLFSSPLLLLDSPPQCLSSLFFCPDVIVQPADEQARRIKTRDNDLAAFFDRPLFGTGRVVRTVNLHRARGRQRTRGSTYRASRRTVHLRPLRLRTPSSAAGAASGAVDPGKPS